MGHVPSGPEDIYGDENIDVDAVLMTEAAMNPKVRLRRVGTDG